MLTTKSIDPAVLPVWPPKASAITASISELVAKGAWGASTGAATMALSEKLASAFGSSHCRLTGSGTAAIELGLKAIPVLSNSEVIMAGFDYPGNIRAIEAGARPVIVDVLPNRWVIDVDQVEQAITESTSAIIASHLYGSLFEAPRLRALADKRGIGLIEDACQAHGANVDGRPACSWGHVSALSFGGSKLMTSGCGGALFTSDARIAQRATIAADRPSPVAPMSQLQAAVLLPQLEMLAQQNQTRRTAMRQLRRLLAESRLWQFADQPAQEAEETAYYKAAWRLPTHIDRDTLLNLAQTAGLPVGPGFRGFLRHARRKYSNIGNLPNSDDCVGQCVVMDHRVLLAPHETIQRIADVMLHIERQFQDFNR